MVHAELFSTGETDLYRQLHDALAAEYPGLEPEGGRPFFVHAAAEDPNRDGYNDDVGAVLDLLKSPGAATRGALPEGVTGPTAATYAGRDLLNNHKWYERAWTSALTQDEVHWFYAHHPNAERLRTYACRFVNEWTRVPRVYGLLRAGRPRRFLWWDDVAAEEEALPGDGYVWYYNPVRLLSLIADPPVPERAAPEVLRIEGPNRVVAGHPLTCTAYLDGTEGWKTVPVRWRIERWWDVMASAVVGAIAAGQAVPTGEQAALLDQVGGTTLRWTVPSTLLRAQPPGEPLLLRVTAQTTGAAVDAERAKDETSARVAEAFTQVVSGAHRLSAPSALPSAAP
jgi:hypothetical protein